MFLARTLVKILPNATVLKQTEMKPYCILKGKPDIVLMDIQMPNKMDMKQREIRLLSYGFQIPIVALTAGIMIDEKRNVLSQE
jgi:CheY-like chemotaxis protein